MDEIIQTVLRTLAERPRDQGGYSWTSGEELQAATHLFPPEINDAVAILEESGLVEVMRYLGTAPFRFGGVSITSRGRYEWQRTSSESIGESREVRGAPEQVMAVRPPTPVGSPFGFTDIDWESVADARSRTNEVRIVLGHQFKSHYFDSEQLNKNVQHMFQKALEDYSTRPGAI